MRTKHTFRLPPDLAAQLADYAHRKRVPQALVVETALSSHLSPDSSERMEAALGRRLDRLRRVEHRAHVRHRRSDGNLLFRLVGELLLVRVDLFARRGVGQVNAFSPAVAANSS